MIGCSATGYYLLPRIRSIRYIVATDVGFNSTAKKAMLHMQYGFFFPSSINLLLFSLHLVVIFKGSNEIVFSIDFIMHTKTIHSYRIRFPYLQKNPKYLHALNSYRARICPNKHVHFICSLDYLFFFLYVFFCFCFRLLHLPTILKWLLRIKAIRTSTRSNEKEIHVTVCMHVCVWWIASLFQLDSIL